MSSEGRSRRSWADDERSVVRSTVDRRDPSDDGIRRAWMQLLLTGAVLVLLAIALPCPWTAIATARGGRPMSGDPVADTAMLLAAGLLVWLLLLWAVIAAAAAVLSRLPGAMGERAGGILRAVAPAMARRVLLTVVGASMVTGLAACGTTAGPAASVMENGHHVAAGRAATGPGSMNIDGRSVAQAGSWILVEGSTIHLPPRTAASLSPVPALDPAVADHDRPARRGAPEQPVNLDWPADDPVTSARVDVDWPASTPGASATALPVPKRTTSGRAPSDERVVVLRGDSLWAIAARHLPAGSSPAQVDTSWHRWYLANRTVIGADPNLLLPGQILQPPPPARPAQRTDDRP